MKICLGHRGVTMTLATRCRPMGEIDVLENWLENRKNFDRWIRCAIHIAK
jgi:hypothetical protein